jgi:hypothetical protein
MTANHLTEYTESQKRRIYNILPWLRIAEIDNDALVVEFLKSHDISMAPVNTKKISPSRLTNAAMGAIGPAAVYMNADITQQKNVAAAQEWTSWKQWAMAHRDWPSFKEKKIKEAEEHNTKVQNYLESEEGIAEIKKILADMNKEIMESGKNVLVFAGVAAVLALIAGFIVLVNSEMEKKELLIDKHLRKERVAK